LTQERRGFCVRVLDVTEPPLIRDFAEKKLKKWTMVKDVSINAMRYGVIIYCTEHRPLKFKRSMAQSDLIDIISIFIPIAIRCFPRIDFITRQINPSCDSCVQNMKFFNNFKHYYRF